MTELPSIHVVAGALCKFGKVLIAQRPPGKHMAGGWEFPGGKLTMGEQPLDGLTRELKEELGVETHTAEWLCECTHEYPDRRVHLELWLVTEYEGVACSNEGQVLQWVDIKLLNDIDMLPADKPLIAALQKRLDIF